MIKCVLGVRSTDLLHFMDFNLVSGGFGVEGGWGAL